MARANEESHSFTGRPHVHLQVEWAMPTFTPQLQCITALWPELISHPVEGRRLSWQIRPQIHFVTDIRARLPNISDASAKYKHWVIQHCAIHVNCAARILHRYSRLHASCRKCSNQTESETETKTNHFGKTTPTSRRLPPLCRASD